MHIYFKSDFLLIDDVCGETNISIIERYPFTIHVHDLSIVKCLWFFTSPNYTFIYLDIAHVAIEPRQSLAVGLVLGIYGNETVLEDGVSLKKSPHNGTSFYFSGNSIWLSFSHATYISGAPSWSFVLWYDDLEGKLSFV